MAIRSRRFGMAATGAALALAGGTAGVLSGHDRPASAADPDVVVVHGTTFPDPSRTALTLVGCDAMYDVSPQTPQPMIGQGPGEAPVGDRSLGYDLAGGDAIGPMFRVSSVVSATTASVAVHPWTTAASGVGYVAYQDAADQAAGLFWVGRTTLSAPGGVWSTIDVAGRDFSWTQYDASTMQVVAQGPAQAEPVATFAAQHGGDGSGFYTVGFGCDGTAFNIDDLKIAGSDGATTYDLEGLTTSVAMTHVPAVSGGTVLRGTLTSGDGEPLPDSTLRLEQSDAPDGTWTTVGAFDVVDGVASTTVDPAAKTFYRWRFVDRPLASGSVSDVDAVDGSGPSASGSPTASATPTSSASATAQPSGGAGTRSPSPSTSAPSGHQSGDSSAAPAGTSAGTRSDDASPDAVTGGSSSDAAGSAASAGSAHATPDSSASPTAHPTATATPSATASGAAAPGAAKDDTASPGSGSAQG